MIYGSVCSGIEAASVAWKALGWKPAFFAEIDPYPSKVLAHQFPKVPNLGDFTTIGPDAGPIDLLVGGTPCQSFSLAGLRGGLDDDRGNLTLEFLRLAARLHPRWIVWENVPGVLSSNGGRDFGSILGGLAELGYGFAYRVLDAQFFGVPQRRRRVFLVGCAGGDWERAAQVLFEPESLQGDLGPRGEAQDSPPTPVEGEPAGGGRFFRMQAFGHYTSSSSSSTLKARDYKDATDLVLEPLAFHHQQDPISGPESPCLSGGAAGMGLFDGGAVRRLTPRECERLQGFPDDWTAILSDTRRYKAIGNSMAVPVVRWIGERIERAEALHR